MPQVAMPPSHRLTAEDLFRRNIRDERTELVTGELLRRSPAGRALRTIKASGANSAPYGQYSFGVVPSPFDQGSGPDQHWHAGAVVPAQSLPYGLRHLPIVVLVPLWQA
jgi:hypothetical protein